MEQCSVKTLYIYDCLFRFLDYLNFISANKNPVLTTSVTVLNITLGDTVNITVTASDADASDTVVISAPNLPSQASFDNETGIFSWKPSDLNVTTLK